MQVIFNISHDLVWGEAYVETEKKINLAKFNLAKFNKKLV